MKNDELASVLMNLRKTAKGIYDRTEGSSAVPVDEKDITRFEQAVEVYKKHAGDVLPEYPCDYAERDLKALRRYNRDVYGVVEGPADAEQPERTVGTTSETMRRRIPPPPGLRKKHYIKLKARKPEPREFVWDGKPIPDIEQKHVSKDPRPDTDDEEE